MSWQKLHEQNARDTIFAQTVQRARDVLTGAAEATFPREELLVQKQVQLTLERAWLVLTEREVRRALQVPRVTKAMMKGVPVIQIPLEDGTPGTEAGYVFADASQPYRTAKVQISYGSAMQIQELAPKDNLYASQSSHWQGDETSKQFKAAGVSDLMAKEINGHLHLHDLQAWLAEAQASLQKDGDNVGQAVPPPSMNEAVRVEMQLEGVAAAAAAVEQAPLTPCQPSKKRAGYLTGSDSLVRAASSASVVTVPDDKDEKEGAERSIVDGSSAPDEPAEGHRNHLVSNSQ